MQQVLLIEPLCADIIKKGSDVSLYNSKGHNLIAGASENTQESAVQVVVENGANMNFFEENGSARKELHVLCLFIGHSKICFLCSSLK